jgi:hypothetical protein
VGAASALLLDPLAQVVQLFPAPAPVPVIPTSLPPNGPASGDLGGTYPGPSVVAVQGRAVQNVLPTDKQILVWSNANSRWQPTTGRVNPTRAVATLLAGFPLTVTQTGIDLSNADCTVVSDGVTPILLFAQVGLANSGANVGKVILTVMDGASTVASSAIVDVAITTGNATIDVQDAVVLTAGTHNLKLHAHKSGANGTITATTGAGDLADTYLRAITFPLI